jgi:hypothetical protein
LRPDHFETILGASFVRRSADTVLRFSSGKSYDRFQLAAIGVPQLKAARHLHLICQRLSIATPTQLAARLMELPAIKGIGHAAFYCALAILAHEGLEERGTTTYADVAVNKQHRNPGTKDWEPVPVKFATLKNRPKPKRKKSA